MPRASVHALLRAAWRLAGPVYRTPARISASIARTGKLARCVAAPGAVIHATARISNNRGRASIAIGEGSHIRGFLETLPHGGSIRIGAHCFVGEGSYVWSAVSIEIGDRVLISHGVNIHDHIAHSLSASRRHAHFVETVTRGAPEVLEDVPSAPVVIEDDAWIGFNATILKGVRIGRGAVVGAGTLVTKDVAPYTCVVGNPPRVVGPSFP